MNSEALLNKRDFSHRELVELLSTDDEMQLHSLFAAAKIRKRETIGNNVYLRGLIEYSNRCKKNCYYCGVRAENEYTQRYTLTDKDVLDATDLAIQLNYGSLAIQSGERSDARFINKIAFLVQLIKQRSQPPLGITLSCGEQTPETYQKWFDAGAHRYLLRVETSNPDLYKRIHPQNHILQKRIDALLSLKEIGFQTGTGVMVGLPGQTIDDLANDLLFFKHIDVHMVGMGPFIPHPETPLSETSEDGWNASNRFDTTLRMLACLRLLMPKINMVASTAMQTLHPEGREKAILAGANIIMPNLTPFEHRAAYGLYPNKPCFDESAEKNTKELEKRLKNIDHQIGYGYWGDSRHFQANNISV